MTLLSTSPPLVLLALLPLLLLELLLLLVLLILLLLELLLVLVLVLMLLPRHTTPPRSSHVHRASLMACGGGGDIDGAH